ncbi:MAG: lysophospholipid acyltransferase family protein [candidate division NC10 bacterium]|nr:lysophospholipid acyltransferase family protein [candidate division NC10 bacterium]
MKGRSLGAYLEYLLAAGLAKLMLRLPSPIAYRIGEALGWVLYLLDGRHRRIAAENLALAFNGRWDPREITRTVRGVFLNLSRMGVEACRIPHLTADNVDQFIQVEGYEHFKRAKAKGKGILWITGHLGPWELLPVASALNGEPLHIVVRPLDNTYLDEAVNRFRKWGGNTIIPKKQALRVVLEALKKGESVALLIDQNLTRKEGVFVEFFGRPACTTLAPALLALRADAVVLPAAIFRRGRDRHTIVIGQEIPLIRTGDLEADIVANTARFTKAIEAFIRQAPDQWFWVHRRWKTQPLESRDSSLVMSDQKQP